MAPEGQLKVVVRCRPGAAGEGSDHLTAVDVPEKPGSSAVIIQKGASASDGLYRFNFSRVLDGAATQQEVYEACGKGLVPGVLEGRNATVIAYGQSGAGKTYSTTGPDDWNAGAETRGLLPRLVEELFSELGKRRLSLSVTCVCVAVTDSDMCDLLREEEEEEEEGFAPEAEAADGGMGSCVTVEQVGSRTVLRGAREQRVEGAVEARTFLEIGRGSLSELSSSSSRRMSLGGGGGGGGGGRPLGRPHLLFALLLRPKGASQGSEPLAKLTLVDLAGRYSVMGTTGSPAADAREAVHSSKSLAFLEQVMVASFKRQQQQLEGSNTSSPTSPTSTTGVPYSYSKLTHFLQDSLGGAGGSRTVLLAGIRTGRTHTEETVATCRFAQRLIQAADSGAQAAAAAPGLSNLHGDLFKLDPVMQGYLETVTAAAVAREKAKLTQRFREQEDAAAAATAEQGGEEAEDLMEQLRDKVEELEEMQEMTQMASAAARKGAVVDRDTLLEMEALRKRLLELEAENAVVEVTVEPQLQRLRQQEEEKASGGVLAAQHPALQQHRAIMEARRSDEELRELLQLKELRDRYRRLQEERSRASPTAQRRPEREREELEKLNDLARKVGLMFPGMSDDGNREVIGQLMDRVKQLEAANALGQVLPGNAPPSSSAAKHAAGAPGAGPKKKTAAGQLRKGISKVLKGAKSTRVVASGDRPLPSVPGGTALSGVSPASSPSEDAAPNIVVLNSLTHEQLMELIKLSKELQGPPGATGPLKALPLPAAGSDRSPLPR